MLKYISRVLVTAGAVVCLFTGYSFAAKDDGFGPASKLESRYFTIYYPQQLDPAELARQLDIHPLDRIITGERSTNDLAGKVDTLFSQVCNILDMQLYSFRGKIKICLDSRQAGAVYENLFGKELTAKKHSFYVNDLKTIYISADYFKREVLGHEMGHIVISHYFAVAPPLKIQEILCVYVEYQLRKLYK